MPDDIGGTRSVSQEEIDKWANESVRGIRSSYSGMRSDSKGNAMREYTVQDDEFSTASEQQNFQYINWHQKNHRNSPAQNCKICVSEQQFKQQHVDLRGKRVASPPCKQCGYAADQHVGPTRECPI